MVLKLNMNVKKLVVMAASIGIIVALAVGMTIGLDKTIRALQQANYFFLLIAFFFNWLSILCINQRWMTVVREAGLKVNGTRLLLISLSGIAFSNLTPGSRMGGEPVRAYLLNKEAKTSTRDSFATIVAERVFDIVGFSLMNIAVIILAVYYHLPFWIITAIIISLMISLGLTALLVFVSVNKKAGLKLTRFFLRKFKKIIARFTDYDSLEKRVSKDALQYSSNVKKFMKHRKLWVIGISYTLLSWVFEITRVYLVFYALGANMGLVFILSMIVISALAGATPFVPGGLGVMESAMIIVYSAAGVGLVTAGVGTLIDRFICFWVFTVIGLIIAYYLGIQHYENSKGGE